NSETLPSSITADTVKTYLYEHPEFLDSFIEQNITSNTIEQWMSKKSQPTGTISMQIQGQSSTSTSTHPHLSSQPEPQSRPSSSSSSSPPTILPEPNNISLSTTDFQLATKP
ncbi:unnamed protein product, partial [Adineta ricciae]